jgi:uncharacterized DUF497 family protein
VFIVIFAWDDINRLHLTKHNVSPQEAQEAVAGARPPYPMEIGDDKLVVWGQIEHGRYLQIIYVLKKPQEVAYESLSIEDWLDVESGEVTEIVRIIHAMDLTPAMKKQFNKRRR